MEIFRKMESVKCNKDTKEKDIRKLKDKSIENIKTRT